MPTLEPSPTTDARIVIALFVALIASTLALILAQGPKRTGRAVNEGRALFQQRCALCHSLGEDGGQGPGLAGVVGRKAAASRFGYSRALRASGLFWDGPTLDRYLAAPAQLVPGTTMGGAAPNAKERGALIAYLSTIRGSAVHEAVAVHSTGPVLPAAPGLRTGNVAFGDYRGDGPGVRRHITVADLPPPYATQAARNSPAVVDRPPNAELSVPPGFRVDRFAEGLKNPRVVRVAPNGDIFIAETGAGEIRVLRAEEGATQASSTAVFAEGLDRPFGISFFPAGPEPGWVYVATNDSVVRFAYANGDLRARATKESVVPKLSDTTEGHSTRDIAFSNDGARMFVSVGSASNVAEDVPLRPPSEIHDWETSHGLGAAWGDEERRADVLVFDPQGKNGHVFATGIRNCVGLAIHPGTGDLWCSTNERDGLGDDLVPDYVTRVREGAFYGWPWYYLGDHEDPRHVGERPDLRGQVTVPDVLLQAHSASLAIAFYDAAAFPVAYRGSAFAALHGSWNRSQRTGPKVVRALVNDGVPTGEYEDFLTGFVVDDEHVWGRPVGIAVARDGALLVTEDGNGTVWRVSYRER